MFLTNVLQVIFTQEDLRNVPTFPDIFKNVPMADIVISDKDTYEKLCHLDANKSPGPDGWQPCFFQRSSLNR